MKRVFKYFTLTGLSGLLCLFLAIPADAQRGGGGHGGGGGGSHGGGGGGFHGGGGGGFGGGSRGGGGFAGGGRASTGFSGGRGVTSPSRGSVTGAGRSYSTGRAVVGGNRGYAGGRAVVGGGNRGYVNGRAVVGGAGGRSYVGGYGRGYYSRGYAGAFGAHGGYFYNRGFYGSLYYPRLGFRLGYLPYGYYPFYWGDSQFYYSNGYYYNYDDGQYTVVEPPVGAAINTLPSKAQAITINGTQYYELNGVYYLPITKDDGSIVYQIAGKDGQLDTVNGGNAPAGQDNTYNGNQQQDQGTNDAGMPTHSDPRVGDMIQNLPQDSRKVKINGETMYVTPDDVYLKQTTDDSGHKAYQVVGVPSGNE